MEPPVVVPLCPPGPEAALAKHLRVCGWLWDDELLVTVVGHLAVEDVCDATALICLDLNDIPAAAHWPTNVREFMQKVVRQQHC